MKTHEKKNQNLYSYNLSAKKTNLVLIYFHLGHNEIRFTSRAQGNYFYLRIHSTLLKDKP